MAVNRRQQQRLLIGLLLVLVALIGYEVTRPTASGRAPSNGVRAAARPRAAGGTAPTGVPTVGLEALKRTQPEPLSAGRNLFQFGAAPMPKPVDGGNRPASVTRPPAGANGSGSVRGGPPPVAPIPLKFIGIVEAPGPMGRVAVLSDGRDVYHGHEGDIIEGRYRIIRIGLESIEMAHLDGSGRQMIRLTGGS